MVVSKKKLSIDSGKLYATTSKKAIEESSDVFINMMIPMMGMIVGLSVIIFAIVMYLMIKVMIDRSAQNIALMKVFGYRKKEIKKLYLDGNFYMIAIGALISVPLSKKINGCNVPSYGFQYSLWYEFKFHMADVCIDLCRNLSLHTW